MKRFDLLSIPPIYEDCIYVGYDPREDVAAKVLMHSIRKHDSEHTPIYPLIRDQMAAYDIFKCPDDKGATQFSLTRFLVPYLMGFYGTGLFLDCDMLFTDDVQKLFRKRNPKYAVYVVKHDYTPKTEMKMDGCVQYQYPRKNWSSVMLFNSGHKKNKILTPEFIAEVGPQYLHRFEWLDDNDIGELSVRWNFLAGEYEKPTETPANIHYTLGGPWFEDYADIDYSDLWLAELAEMQSEVRGKI